MPRKKKYVDIPGTIRIGIRKGNLFIEVPLNPETSEHEAAIMGLYEIIKDKNKEITDEGEGE